MVIHLAKGLPKSIIKKYGISKKAWSVYRGRKRKTSRTRKTKVTRRKGVRRMARRKRRRGGKSITQQAFKWIRVGALVAPAVAVAVGPGSQHGKARTIIHKYTGFNIDDQSFNIERLLQGWGPYLGAVVATYGIPKLAGILRRL